MTEEEHLEQARGNAYSFPGLTPPNGAWLIGAVEKEEDTIYYYMDAEGNYYYDTGKMRRFELEMQQRAKEREKQRWRKKKRAV